MTLSSEIIHVDGNTSLCFSEGSVDGGSAVDFYSAFNSQCTYELVWKSGELDISFVLIDGYLVVDLVDIGKGDLEGIEQVQIGHTLVALNGESLDGKSTEESLDLIKNAKLPTVLMMSRKVISNNISIHSFEQQSFTALSSAPLISLHSKKYPPLQVAISSGDVELTRAIISKMKAKKCFNFDEQRNQSILHVAVRSNRLEIVRLFCKLSIAKELMNLIDNNGNTALHFAIGKSPGFVSCLLVNGANPNIKNKWNHTPLTLCVLMASKNTNAIAHLLLQTNCFNSKDKAKLLHMAIDAGLIETAGVLVRYGASMASEDESGKTVFEKINKANTKLLISQITSPTEWIGKHMRPLCMLCKKSFGIFTRTHNCRLCGRITCNDCAGNYIELCLFPNGFPGRISKNGKPVKELQQVCNTCHLVLKSRANSEKKHEVLPFFKKLVGIEWIAMHDEKK